MAKSKWNLDKATLTCTSGDTITNIDLATLFPEFDNMDDVQQMAIAYGIKQKLSDACARPKDQTLTSAEAKVVMINTYERVVGGDWNQGRTGAVSYKSKINSAVAKATDAEKKVLRKLGLID